MVSAKKTLEIKNLTGRLIYKPSAIESELEKRLERQSHSLGEPHLLREDYDDGRPMGFFFYLTRNTDDLDGRGTGISYRKGTYKGKRAFEELVREEIDNSKHESIRLVGNGGYLVLSFLFIYNRLVEISNAGNYETIQFLKKAYTDYFLESALKNKKILLPDIKQDLESKSINEIIDFIISSIDYGRASRN